MSNADERQGPTESELTPPGDNPAGGQEERVADGRAVTEAEAGMTTGVGTGQTSAEAAGADQEVAGKGEDGEVEDVLELEELERLEAAGPAPGETREQFARRLHEAQVARHKRRQEQRQVRRAKGLVIVNTGNGKGKTTAALGVLFRAWGRGMRVCMLQFIKATTSNYGETRAARRLGIEIIPMGDGFTWLSEDIEKDKATARQCWELCKSKINSGDYDIVILDEMTYTLSYGWLDTAEVIEVLKNRPAGQHVIITGRNAVPELVEYADLVTEMNEIKHPYRQGIQAQKGIEF